MPEGEREALLEMHHWLEEGDQHDYEQVANVEYETAPADIRTFLTDPYFLGESGGSLWERLKDDLVELFEGDYHEAALGGSLGWGKTFAATTAMAYVLYQMSCLRNPQSAYGIAPGSHIYLAMLSVTERVARRVPVNELIAKITHSRYFKEKFPSRAAPSLLEVRFPKQIMVVAGSTGSSAIIGMNAFCGFIDECVVGETEILTPDGYASLDSVYKGDVTITPIMAYNEETGRVERSTGKIRRATNTQIFDVAFDDGRVLTATSETPFLVVGEGYVPLDRLRAGDEVVATHAARASWRKESLLRPEAFQGVAQENVGGGQSKEREEEAYRGNQAEDTSCEFAHVGHKNRPRRNGDDGCRDRKGTSETTECEAPQRRVDQREAAASSQPYERTVGGPRISQADAGSENFFSAHRRIQEASVGEKSNQEICSQREDEEASEQDYDGALGKFDFSICGVCGHEKRRSVWLPFPLGKARYSSSRSRSFGRNFRVRAVWGALSVQRQVALYAAGFFGDTHRRFGTDDRGEAQRVYLRRENEGSERGLPHLLQGKRVDLRGLGRKSSVARVVSVQSAGSRPTFDVMSVPQGNFIANGMVIHNTSFFGTAKEVDRMGREVVTDKGEAIYKSIIRRMKSRFLKVGRLPGLMILASSKERPTAFVEKRIEQAREQGDPHFFVREYATWDVKPKRDFTQEMFKVVVGNEKHHSRILSGDPDEEEKFRKMELQIIEVPLEYKEDFERDLDGSIRDVAGYATMAVSPYIHRTEMVYEAADDTLVCPMGGPDPGEIQEEWLASTPLDIHWGKIARAFQRRLPGGYTETDWRPIRHPDAIRYAHVDPSLSGDSSGLTIAHIAGWTEVVRRDKAGEEYSELAPLIETDLVLRVVPPPGDEILLSDVRAIVYQFCDHGFNVRYVTMDSYQSADALQQYRKRGIEAEVLSVDKTSEPYDVLKTTMYESRLRMHLHTWCQRELTQLQRVPKPRGKGYKIDHPKIGPDGKAGTKDVADSVAAVVYNLTSRAPSMPIPIQPGVTDRNVPQAEDDSWVTDGKTLVRQESSKKAPAGGIVGTRPQDPSDKPMPFIKG
jgi:hypothetical protein